MVRFCTLLLMTFCLLAGNARAAEDEDRIKALYIINFASFVTWPENGLQDDRGTILCSIGENSVTAQLQMVLKDYKAPREMVLRTNIPLNLIKHCHVLYIPDSAAGDLPTLLTTLKPYPVLTVSGIPDFIHKGGMIGLQNTEKQLGLYADRKVNYEVNLQPVKEVNLQLDPRLLELAAKVEGVQP